MHLSFITGNVLQKFTKNKYNVIYNPQNNLFDIMLFMSVEHYFYLFSNNKKNYNLSNVIDLPQDYINLYNYNIHCTNDIIGYTTSSNNIKQFHINTLIFTHSYKPSRIKKEDTVLINEALQKEQKIFFSENAQNSWNTHNNSVNIRYGIPKEFYIDKKPSDRKDILILNYENLHHNQQLHQALLSNGYTCDISSSSINSPNFINTQFNEYKICIDLAEHNVSNLLCAVGAGCIGLSVKTPMLVNDFNLPGLFLVDSIEHSIEIIKELLSIPDNDKELFSKEAHKTFDFDIFSKHINDLFIKANTEAFVL